MANPEQTPKKPLLLPLHGEPSAPPPNVPGPAPAAPRGVASGLQYVAPNADDGRRAPTVRSERTFEATDTGEDIDLNAIPAKRQTMAEIEVPRSSSRWVGVAIAAAAVLAVPASILLIMQRADPRRSKPAPVDSTANVAATVVELPKLETRVTVPKSVTTALLDDVPVPIDNRRVVILAPVGSHHQLLLKFKGGQHQFDILVSPSGAVPNKVEF